MELDVIDDDEPLLYDEAKQVQELFVCPDLFEDWLVLLDTLIAEGLHGVGLANVLKEDLQDV